MSVVGLKHTLLRKQAQFLILALSYTASIEARYSLVECQRLSRTTQVIYRLVHGATIVIQLQGE
ncbi:hypothetical protein SBC1_54190 (plasmid) [Caballeronia sp. SBC1]|nr:hypothetical protein SBC2_52190 [Caballeronia sp. SBC2]QIN65374.1 hypothetical protein SBC1_54190 [Caballeronia sp. SBC1]